MFADPALSVFKNYLIISRSVLTVVTGVEGLSGGKNKTLKKYLQEHTVINSQTLFIYLTQQNPTLKD